MRTLKVSAGSIEVHMQGFRHILAADEAGDAGKIGGQRAVGAQSGHGQHADHLERDPPDPDLLTDGGRPAEQGPSHQLADHGALPAA